MKKNDIKIPKNTLEAIIENYTRESGVRELEKKIGKILRKSLVILISIVAFVAIVAENAVLSTIATISTIIMSERQLCRSHNRHSIINPIHLKAVSFSACSILFIPALDCISFPEHWL